jgi:hypothetical protein
MRAMECDHRIGTGDTHATLSTGMACHCVWDLVREGRTHTLSSKRLNAFILGFIFKLTSEQISQT